MFITNLWHHPGMSAYTATVLSVGVAILIVLAIRARPRSVWEALRLLFPLNAKIGVTITLVAATYVILTTYATPRMYLP